LLGFSDEIGFDDWSGGHSEKREENTTPDFWFVVSDRAEKDFRDDEAADGRSDEPFCGAIGEGCFYLVAEEICEEFSDLIRDINGVLDLLSARGNLLGERPLLDLDLQTVRSQLVEQS
jgi:hypothetical protein